RTARRKTRGTAAPPSRWPRRSASRDGGVGGAFQVCAVVARRALGRHIAFRDVASYRRRRALGGRPVSGATREAHFDDLLIARRRDKRARAAVLDDGAGAVPDDAERRAAGATAEESLDFDADAFRIDGGERRQAVGLELTHPYALAEAAAMATGTARVGDQHLFQHQHRNPLLEELDRGAGGGRGPEERRDAIGRLRSALPATHEEMVGVDATVGVAAVDGDRDRQAGGGLHAIGRGVCERAEDVRRDVPAG